MRDRIVELRRVPAGELRPAPKNWRTHPEIQRSALTAVMEQIGIVDAVIHHQHRHSLIGQHIGAQMAVDQLQALVGLASDLDAAEAEMALATIDPLAAMAETNAEMMRSLLDGLETQPEINYGHLYQELDVDLVRGGGNGATAADDLAGASSGSEWWTPAPVIAAAREVMGGIDLDVASCAAANDVVGADRFYTIADDGLQQPWEGRVWCNPPFGQAARWAASLFDHLDGDDVDEACLVGPITAANWMRQAWDTAAAVVLLERSDEWRGPDAEANATGAPWGFGLLVCYWGAGDPAPFSAVGSVR